MNIVIYCEHKGGKGDFFFALKMKELLKKTYPRVHIQIVASPTYRLIDQEELQRFCRQYDILLFPLVSAAQLADSQHLERPPKLLKRLKLLLVCPAFPLSIQSQTILQNHILAPNTKTTICLISEYNTDTGSLDSQRSKLVTSGYSSVFTYSTGIKHTSTAQEVGIFIEEELVNFNRDDDAQLNSLCNPRWLWIKDSTTKRLWRTLLGNQTSVSSYVRGTEILVNYSSDNSKRFLKIYLHLLTEAVKNTDIIMMGEAKGTDKPSLRKLTDDLIRKGFSRVIYQTLDATEIIGSNTQRLEGPVLRLIHTGFISSLLSKQLRKIGGEVAGATGDQSASECLSRTGMMIYECREWKKPFGEALKATAANLVRDKPGTISAKLPRAVELLIIDQEKKEAGESAEDIECKELAGLLAEPEIRESFRQYQEYIIKNNSLPEIFTPLIRQIIDPLLSTSHSWIGRLRQRFSQAPRNQLVSETQPPLLHSSLEEQGSSMPPLPTPLSEQFPNASSEQQPLPKPHFSIDLDADFGIGSENGLARSDTPEPGTVKKSSV